MNQFTFADLFAGIGGFHAALHAAGGRWAFASEIDQDAARVYDYNWLRPLRQKVGEKSSPRYRVSGDLIQLTDPKFVGDRVAVPRADVLAAGFPCQPFSKSGHQRGMAETRGSLFWNIARILQDETKRPSVVLLENVRNLAGPRHEDTFETIVATLRQLGYRTASRPAVLSPHLLPPRMGGRPQARERVFILAHYVGRSAAEDTASFDDPIVTPSTLDLDWRKDDWNLAEHLPLDSDEFVKDQYDGAYDLESAEVKWIDTWDRLLSRVAERLEPGERLPGFPIWADDFRTLPEAEDMIEIASLRGDPYPSWKTAFLLKNARFYERHAEVIDPFRLELDAFPASRRKFEWQAGPHRPLSDTIMHFRPSGIRCKRPDYVPALVAITQTSVLGDRRRLTPDETARLQGLPRSFRFMQSEPGWDDPVRQKDSASYKQVGNGVNVGAAYYVFRKYVLHHRQEIPARIVRAVEQAGVDVDQRLRQLQGIEA